MSARGESAREEVGDNFTNGTQIGVRKKTKKHGHRSSKQSSGKPGRQANHKSLPQEDAPVHNKDAVQALRLASLVVGFSNASAPISSKDIHEAWYRGSSKDTFDKSFRRDRERLEQCGFILCPAGKENDLQLWKIDEEASLAEEGVISDEEAVLLEIILTPLTSDPSFTLRDELVLALAKVNRSFKEHTAPPSGGGDANIRLDTLVRALELHKLVRVKYRRADGEETERVLALFGTFGLRSSTYFVADTYDSASRSLAGRPHTYRLDRFSSARLISPETASTAYTVPADFDINDYQHLPFQMGDPLGEASFAVPDVPTLEVTRAIDTHGRLSENGLTWHIPFSDVRATARWAHDNELQPLGPERLADVWREVLAIARECRPETMSAEVEAVYDHHVGHDVASGRATARLSDTNGRGAGEARRRTGAGRRGGLATARMLVILIGALQTEGDTINAKVAADRLSCTEDEARELLSLLAAASDFGGTRRLPLITKENLSETTLAYSTATGRPVRLTKRESKALLLALGEAGMDVSSPLIAKLIRSLVYPAFDQAEVSALLDGSRHAPACGFRDALAACSKALAKFQDLTFSYTDGAGRTRDRRIIPERLFREEDRWYVQGFDLARQEGRVFRLDRMANVQGCTPESNPAWAMTGLSTAGANGGAGNGADAPTESAPAAFFEVLDESLIDLFSWPNTEIVHKNGRVFAIADDYGTTWLPRRLAACAGGVRIFDENLAARVRAWAQGITE
ncbi:MAG: WYL domain-containing protein [Olsenella sp.]|nr:WYL domain-containing protein [Olsenella sp.]